MCVDVCNQVTVGQPKPIDFIWIYYSQMNKPTDQFKTYFQFNYFLLLNRRKPIPKKNHAKRTKMPFRYKWVDLNTFYKFVVAGKWCCRAIEIANKATGNWYMTVYFVRSSAGITYEICSNNDLILLFVIDSLIFIIIFSFVLSNPSNTNQAPWTKEK